MTAIRFEVLTSDPWSGARLGVVHTPHGPFMTPAFMPVGTRGSVKGIPPSLLAQTGAEICLGNTYHLLLRPGPDTVAKLGGLQTFTGWHGPMLTDSGGYQAFSMADTNAITEDGVVFKSIVDGSRVLLTPERATQVQNALGADIMMAFDDCPPGLDSQSAPDADARDAPRSPATTDARAERAMQRDRVTDRAAYAARLRLSNERTVRWLERCVRAHQRPADQALFGIVQGGSDLDQRSWSAERICAFDLPGFAIGGVAVGESSAEIRRVVRHTAPLLPAAKPRYLMGVGYERDLLAAVLAGVDMFDCVLPTRNGRNANAFTPAGQVRLRNAKFAGDSGPIQPGCDCHACRPPVPIRGASAIAFTAPNAAPGTSIPSPGPFSRGYLRHLFMADEMLGPILVSLHNLRHFQRFMAAIRGVIAAGGGEARWRQLAADWPTAAPALSGLPGFPADFTQSTVDPT